MLSKTSQIALQSCVSIAKIARHDYPSTWPTLFSDLQSFMSSAHAELANLGPAPTDGSSESPERGAKRTRNTLILMRAADVTSRTLKELESAKMLAGKIRMAEVSSEKKHLPVSSFFVAYRLIFADLLSPYLARTLSPPNSSTNLRSIFLGNFPRGSSEFTRSSLSVGYLSTKGRGDQDLTPASESHHQTGSRRSRNDLFSLWSSFSRHRCQSKRRRLQLRTSFLQIYSSSTPNHHQH